MPTGNKATKVVPAVSSPFSPRWDSLSTKSRTVEYFFGLIKMLFIIMMIVLNTALHIKQGTGHQPFWTYNEPYSFTSQNITLPNGYVATGGGARLGAMWDAMVSCLFGLIGFETIAITAPENRDLRKEET